MRIEERCRRRSFLEKTGKNSTQLSEGVMTNVMPSKFGAAFIPEPMRCEAGGAYDAEEALMVREGCYQKVGVFRVLRLMMWSVKVGGGRSR